MKKLLRNSLLLFLIFTSLSQESFGQNVNVSILQAEYDHSGAFTGYPMDGIFTVIWRKDQQNISLAANTVLVKIVFVPEVGYNSSATLTIPSGWQVQGTPTATGLTLVNSVPFSSEDEVVVNIPVKATTPRSSTLAQAGAYIQNDGGDWTNVSPGWDVSTSVTVAATPLPVKLANISAKAVEDAILVSWKTTEEVNFDHFELQSSVSPKTGYKHLSTIATTGNNKGNDYTYTDREAESGMPVYYRLKMIDKDGSFAYSRIVTAELSGELIASIYPNPASHVVNISASQAISEAQLINLSGYTVVTKGFNGTSKKEALPVGQIAPGPYQVKITTKNGSVQYKKVVILQ